MKTPDMLPKSKFGLHSNIIEQIVAVLNRNDKTEKAVLFGSRAKGNFQTGSDVDIALYGNALNLDDILSLHTELDNLDLPYQFDLVIYSRIQENALKEHIDRVGVVLFEQ